MTHHFRSRTAALIATGFATMWLVGCGGGYSSSPTTPYPSPTPTPAPTPSPDPSPTPAPGPTPSPTPSPDPTPTPAPTPTPSPTPAPTIVIQIVAINGNMSFSPATANVRVGQQVVWHNAHSDTHTATQDGGGFDTGLIRPGATSAPITVTAPGTLRYHCEIHPVMVGVLDVAQ
jgi:plastocyanin